MGRFKIDLVRPATSKVPIKTGSVTVVDAPDGSEEGYAIFVADEDGTPMAWYSGCGSHHLTITRAFLDYLQESK